MCGIFGHIISDGDKSNSRRALHTLSHRGPDQWADWQDSNIYLGHQRLSIIDLSEKGRQPMKDGDVVITVNGEIYNFKLLRQELSKKYRFNSDSDSEVLIHGYKEWGIKKLLSKIEGMYAFALYDKRKSKLYLARDRVGIKPLYFSRFDGRAIAWASELKALEMFHSREKLDIDYTAVYDYLTYLYVPAPKTLYINIYKLEPAHFLEVDIASGDIKNNRYWQLDPYAKRSISLEEAAQKVRDLVGSAVKEQVVSDVPVGYFLSGGLDSSTVVATAASLGKKLQTYSIGFDVPEHDETKFAEKVAKKFKTKHVRKIIGVDNVKSSFSKIRYWFDEPFADTSAFPVHLVSSLARKNSTVVLTGDGGDEVFGGYNWYNQFKKGAKKYVRSNSRITTLIKPILGKSAKDRMIGLELEYYTTLMGGLTKSDKQDYKNKFKIPDSYDDYWHFRKHYLTDLPLLTRLQYMDFHTYLPGDILTKVDRTSMAVSLECRVPLLSTPLIEYVFSLPENIRYYNNELKGLMKYSFRDVLPAEILERDKKGFSIPTGKWKSKLMNRKAKMPEYILDELFPEFQTINKNGAK